jgi:hypothetical protein
MFNQPIINHRSQITYIQIFLRPITNHQSPITNHKSRDIPLSDWSKKRCEQKRLPQGEPSFEPLVWALGWLVGWLVGAKFVELRGR